MGHSFTILKRNPLELSIEVERGIDIEISTGFNGPEVTSCCVASLSLELDDLDKIIERLTNIRDQLREGWRCETCKCYNPPDETECYFCEEPNDSTS